MPTTRKRMPAHGSVERYRIELATEGVTPCERCKRANANKAARQRADAKAKARRDEMRIVDEVPAEDTDLDTPREPGPVELAVQADIEAIAEKDRVRFHGSLSQLALAAAREMDSARSSAARTAARKDVFDVLKSLGAREGSDGNTALDAALEDFGAPLPGVSGVSA